MKRFLSLSLAFVACGAFAQAPTGSLKKAIVPIVGSAAGANGAQFKTSLRIQALPGAHGRIVFHPLNGIARPDDPSIPYSFPENAKQSDFIQYDDVAAAIGQTGLGTLDVIPDPDGGNIFPPVTTRVFNDTPHGTFGTEEGLSYPVKYFAPDTPGVQFAVTYVPAMSSRFRRNIGFRTLSNVSLSAYIVRKDGSRVDTQVGFFPGEYTTMMSVEDFARNFMQTTIGPDDALGVFATGKGQAILFYTYTDNGTNDPTLVVTPPNYQPLLLADIPS